MKKTMNNSSRAFIYTLIFILLGTFMNTCFGITYWQFLGGIILYTCILASLDIKDLLYHKKGVVHYEANL